MATRMHFARIYLFAEIYMPPHGLSDEQRENSSVYIAWHDFSHRVAELHPRSQNSTKDSREDHMHVAYCPIQAAAAVSLTTEGANPEPEYPRSPASTR